MACRKLVRSRRLYASVGQIININMGGGQSVGLIISYNCTNYKNLMCGINVCQVKNQSRISQLINQLQLFSYPAYTLSKNTHTNFYTKLSKNNVLLLSFQQFLKITLRKSLLGSQKFQFYCYPKLLNKSIKK